MQTQHFLLDASVQLALLDHYVNIISMNVNRRRACMAFVLIRRMALDVFVNQVSLLLIHAHKKIIEPLLILRQQ